jgi:hypothetical protein
MFATSSLFLWSLICALSCMVSQYVGFVGWMIGLMEESEDASGLHASVHVNDQCGDTSVRGATDEPM